MAEIVSRPSGHDCRKELAQDLPDPRELPVMTIARCSCQIRFIIVDDQREGQYWSEIVPAF